MSLVYDSSAMLAYLQGEEGGDMVRDLLEDADVPHFAHAVNLCEVHYDFLRRAPDLWAQAALDELRLQGIVERTDMDQEFRRSIAFLITDARTEGGRLALGDAFGLALARRLDADFVTADRHELEPLAEKGIARITFIR